MGNGDKLTTTKGMIFAWGQRTGGRTKQEDVFRNFSDECFAVADGVGGWPHGEVAARLASETALWGYREIRKRRCYWLDKKLLLRRIFRSTNLTLWQKRREKGFEEGLITTLVVAILSERTFWVGSVGDSLAYLYRETLIDQLTKPEVDESGHLTNAIGLVRYGLTVQIVSERFLPGDILLIATDGVTNYLEEEQLRSTLDNCGYAKSDLQEAVKQLLDQAEANGSADNLTVCLIKRL